MFKKCPSQRINNVNQKQINVSSNKEIKLRKKEKFRGK
jgi:hypothetical protein